MSPSRHRNLSFTLAFISCMVAVLLPTPLYAQFEIMTICASNDQMATPDSAFFPDFFIIKNHSEESLNASNLLVAINDDSAIPIKGPDILVAPDSSLTIWCCRKCHDSSLYSFIRHHLPMTGGNIAIIDHDGTLYNKVSYPPLYLNEHFLTQGNWNSSDDTGELIGISGSESFHPDSAKNFNGYIITSSFDSQARIPEMTTFGLHEHSLPVVSIVAPPLELTGWFGILQKPGAMQRIPSRWEIIEPNGTSNFKASAELMTHSPNSNPQRSFRLTAKNEYGSARFHYPLFGETYGDEINSLLLRTAGEDGINLGGLGLRDLLASRLANLLSPELYPSVGFPVITYLNGEYYGIQNLRARQDRKFLDRTDKHDMFVERDAKKTSTWKYGSRADSIAWQSVQMIAHDVLSGTRLPGEMALHVDTEAFIDYFLLEIYAGNQDWLTNNMKFLRNAKSHKWHPVICDLDWGFGRFSNHPSGDSQWNSIEYALSPTAGWNNETPSNMIFRALMQDPSFKKQFLDRATFLLNTAFSPKVVLEYLNEITSQIEPELELHCEHWKIDPVNYQLELQRTTEWINERSKLLLQHLSIWYSGHDATEVVLFANAEGACLSIDGYDVIDHTVVIPQGSYLELEAIEIAGHRFVQWVNKSDEDDHQTQINSGDSLIIALYAPLELPLNKHQPVIQRQFNEEEPTRSFRPVRHRRIVSLYQEDGQQKIPSRSAFNRRSSTIHQPLQGRWNHIVITEKVGGQVRFIIVSKS